MFLRTGTKEDIGEALHRPTSTYPALQQAKLTIACTSRIPEGAYDNALFMITPSTITGDLALDLLENIHQVLKMHARCLITYDGKAGGFACNPIPKE